MKPIIFIFLILTISCTIKMPEIQITGERTTLEKQILGEYMEIEDKQWFLISERSVSNKDFEIGKNRKMIEAIRKRIFLRDEIKEFKIKGYIGEDITSLVAVISPKKLEKLSKKDRDRIYFVVDEENMARSIIILTLSESYIKRDVKRAFYNLNIDTSPEGSFYRDSNGDWEKK
ncbi:MAG: hypothetical protein CR982_07625 [Candidatus Cloacimonadota bacterium]|nr:MAG: hypothetical protein CR982_07625 [Candidatus Cloacimonadota bacterium]PIE78276.1 MAG: hypothetical protein CSA15_08915 [Candidatus Delongbacteria bacterium]